MKDKMIPIEQAKQLKERCFGPCTLVTPINMTHNRFDILFDLITPMKSFLLDSELIVDSDDEEENKSNFNKSRLQLSMQDQRSKI